jgi:hypothetical protein
MSAAQDPVDEDPWLGWAEARSAGACVGCGNPYTDGTLIKADERTGLWRAECCNPAAPPAGTDLWALGAEKTRKFGRAA